MAASAPSVSAALRRAGFKPVGTTGHKREGLRVKRTRDAEVVRVVADLDSDSAAERMITDVISALTDAGYIVLQAAANAVYVSR